MPRHSLRAVISQLISVTGLRRRAVNRIQRLPLLEMLGRFAQGERLVILRSLAGERRVIVLDTP